MFRKPKRDATKNAKVGFRRKRSHDDDDDDDNSSHGKEDDGGGEGETNLAEARQEQAALGKRAKFLPKGNNNSTNHSANQSIANRPTPSVSSTTNKSLLHQFETSKEGPATQKDMATRSNEYHPTTVIDRNNKFLAGPIKAPTNIRTTCRFDYQPDICKDYKDTGFCGFGDTCIYLHDRGDFLSGWQLEQQWQQQQEEKKQKQKQEIDDFLSKAGGGVGGSSASQATESLSMTDDGLPFACHICRDYFKDPVVTNCSHYFCSACLLEHVKSVYTCCPICSIETHGVFHEPTKLLNKKRKVSGRDSTWKDFKEGFQQKIHSASTKTS